MCVVFLSMSWFKMQLCSITAQLLCVTVCRVLWIKETLHHMYIRCCVVCSYSYTYLYLFWFLNPL